ncbi:transglycosylase SLT domain-containing protein [Sphingomonas oligophenolica]
MIKSGLLLAGVSGLAVTSNVAQDQLGWGRAQQALEGSAAANSALSSTIAQWKSLQGGSAYPFDTYARFLLAHPGWPNEMSLRRNAENALTGGSWSTSTAVAYFRRFPPLTAAGKVRFADALWASGAQAEARLAAEKAWVSGTLSPSDETRMIGNFSSALTLADHDARMDMLLWQGSIQSAQRQLALVSPSKRPLFEARLAFRTNAANAADLAAATEAMGAGDAGYLADRATWFRNNGATPSARSLLARRQALTSRPGDVEDWFEVLLTNARGAAADAQYSTAFDIARQVDDAYPAGTDVSGQPFGERDNYTSLMWLAGQTALKQLGRPSDATGMFLRYAGGSKTPTTQSKGLYWAGRAAEAAGRRDEANGYYARAAGFPDLFYGQLAMERLGEPLIPPGDPLMKPVDPVVRTAFYNRETVRAAQYLGTAGDWEDQTAFVRQIAIDAKTDSDHVLATELSRSLGRPDLGVMVGRSALQNGLSEYSTVGFPNVRVPATSNDSWTIIHAIARQESQFNRAAVSHAGARGLMQLMPGTARDVSTKMGLGYNPGALTTDTDYNIMVGSTYFQHIYNIYYSWPLAVAAYNAGPGNVNKWIRANGDPRTPGVDIVDWIEAIPIYETKNYVQRVLENAVVYDLMNPQHSRSQGANRLSWYLGKNKPG